MKRIFALLMTLVVIVAFATVTFAENGGFYESPSKNQAPTLDSFENENDECEATLHITSYADRDQLSEEAQQKLAAAFDTILNATDLTTVNSGLANLAKELGIAGTDLAVSDLFDISYHEEGDHSGHGAFTVALNAETLKNFVAFLHYENGQWVLVEDAKVVDGEKLTFTVDTLSPFAVVVNTNPAVPGSAVGLPVGAIIAIVAAAVAVAGGIAFLVFFLLKKKKKKDTANA